MINKIFEQLGLGEKESEAYECLLQNGAMKASEVARRLGLPRTTTQHILSRLEREQVVVKALENRSFVYSALNPEHFISLLTQRKKEALLNYDSSIEEVKSLIPELLNVMQSAKSVPEMRVYRGRQGMREVLFDTLTSKTELKDFTNVDAMYTYFKEGNDEYVSVRETTNITKRSILLDTEFAREIYQSGEYSPKSHKGYKWIPSDLYTFSIEMNIYDNKVSYLNYVENDLIAVIIENEHIFQLHNSLWDLLWNLLPESE